MRIYKKGAGLKKDKAMDKLVELEDKGEPEKWVKDQLAKSSYKVLVRKAFLIKPGGLF